MKIKLQDYSLISNEWIDKEIDRLTKVAKACIADNVNVNVYVHTIKCLENVKQQLIPSEETLYTEEDLRKAYEFGKGIGGLDMKDDFETFIQSLKLNNL